MSPKIPPHAEHYFRTKTFTAHTTPLALRQEHRTGEDVWGEIVVERGEVAYESLGEDAHAVQLTPERRGVVQPGVPHRVTPSHDALFHLELYRTRRHNARTA
jgi:tellurite resistance-related uncharacterized protein